MASWKISRASLLLLAGVLTVIVLVLVLPQIDLPATAFHRGTAPVVEHARASSSPGLLTVRILTPVMFSREAAESALERSSLSHSTLQSLPILHKSLRC
ncbi:MAG: hypothetical protein WB952_03645 [Terriglobales bacterium]